MMQLTRRSCLALAFVMENCNMPCEAEKLYKKITKNEFCEVDIEFSHLQKVDELINKPSQSDRSKAFLYALGLQELRSDLELVLYHGNLNKTLEHFKKGDCKNGGISICFGEYEIFAKNKDDREKSDCVWKVSLYKKSELIREITSVTYLWADYSYLVKIIESLIPKKDIKKELVQLSESLETYSIKDLKERLKTLIEGME